MKHIGNGREYNKNGRKNKLQAILGREVEEYELLRVKNGLSRDAAKHKSYGRSKVVGNKKIYNFCIHTFFT